MALLQVSGAILHASHTFLYLILTLHLDTDVNIIHI